MTTAVGFNNVSIIFGDRPATALKMADEGKSRDEIGKQTGLVLGVANASLEIEEGEILVLMGLSGSGKSTLLRAVNGLAPVVRGDVMVKSKSGPVNPYSCNPKALRDLRMHTVSMVFQQFALLPWRTVADNVGFGLELAGTTPRSGTFTCSNIRAPRRAILRLTSCGVVTITAPVSGKFCASVNCVSPVPGGRSRIR